MAIFLGALAGVIVWSYVNSLWPPKRLVLGADAIEIPRIEFNRQSERILYKDIKQITRVQMPRMLIGKRTMGLALSTEHRNHGIRKDCLPMGLRLDALESRLKQRVEIATGRRLD